MVMMAPFHHFLPLFSSLFGMPVDIGAKKGRVRRMFMTAIMLARAERRDRNTSHSFTMNTWSVEERVVSIPMESENQSRAVAIPSLLWVVSLWLVFKSCILLALPSEKLP